MDADAQMETTNEADENIPGETKADRFRRIGTRRLRNILNQMRLLGNCASPANYEYTQEQVETIFKHLDKAVEDLKTAFNPKAKQDDLPSL